VDGDADSSEQSAILAFSPPRVAVSFRQKPEF
jgi:hypothetical protein